MSNIMAWDELTLLKQEAVSTFNRRKSLTKEDIERFCDYMEFVLCLIYGYGWKDAEQIVGIVPFKDGLDDRCVNLDIKGETFRDRVAEQAELDSLDGLLRIINTEAHRDYNTGVYDAGKRSGQNVKKRWETMRDWKVRETHNYLQSTVVGIDDLFYTFDGDSAYAPGGFSQPENNVNCRCWITLVK